MPKFLRCETSGLTATSPDWEAMQPRSVHPVPRDDEQRDGSMSALWRALGTIIGLLAVWMLAVTT